MMRPNRTWSFNCSQEGEPYFYDNKNGHVGWFMPDPDLMMPYMPLPDGREGRQPDLISHELQNVDTMEDVLLKISIVNNTMYVPNPCSFRVPVCISCTVWDGEQRGLGSFGGSGI